MYDFDNSACVATVVTAFSPAHFAAVVAKHGLLAGQTIILAVSQWGYAVRLAALLFFVLRQATGAARPAVLTLVVIFVADLVLLARVRLENNDA